MRSMPRWDFDFQADITPNLAEPEKLACWHISLICTIRVLRDIDKQRSHERSIEMNECLSLENTKINIIMLKTYRLGGEFQKPN